jgi:hypothetical protein
VVVTMPTIGIAGPTTAELAVILPDGRLAQQLAVELLPAGETTEVAAK